MIYFGKHGIKQKAWKARQYEGRFFSVICRIFMNGSGNANNHRYLFHCKSFEVQAKCYI